MTYNTINDAQTIAGSGEGTLLANRYHVVRQLGQGGMGSVWLAEDTQLDNKPFAIKMLPSILVSNKRAYRQLKDEALVAMKLTHPNIVTLRAFEENNGNPFLVMDYIDGQTLDDYLAEKGKLPEADVLRILRPIAAALDYAHSEGVVHRDVKPANVMIRKDGHPYILDFGVAREIQETMTRVTGKLSSGTLLYMSPEQLRGQPPKPAQDIYSFAAVVYECLKGEPPFVRGQIEFQILNEQPESPPGGTQLVASVMVGLAKKPEDRPPTCAAVLDGKDFTQRRGEAEAQSGRAGVPRPPQGNENVRLEHVEQVEGNARDGGEGRFSWKRVTQLVALLGLVVVVGVCWLWLVAIVNDGNGISPTQSERGVRRRVQLWEGGPYWAYKNIGAEEPWEYGYYFWWGDTVGYKHENGAWVASDGSSLNFSFMDKNTPTYDKDIAKLKSEGWISTDGVLAPHHDAAQVQWGKGWRMPTKQELDDLCKKCEWTWTTKNGVNGHVVRGRGDYASASIFLPAAGGSYRNSLYDTGSSGSYWSSVPHSDSNLTWDLQFYPRCPCAGRSYRSRGQSVRPVQGFTK